MPSLAQRPDVVRARVVHSNIADVKPFTFEVVSIKPLKAVAPPLHLDPTPTGFTSPMTTWQMIMFAYAPEDPFLWLLRRQTTTITNDPIWLYDLYQISAHVSDADRDAWNHQGGERELLRSALRELLHDRYKLIIHERQTLVPGYKLVVSKHGPRLTPTTPNTALPKGLPLPSGGVVVSTQAADYWHGATMGDLAHFLTRTSERTVNDATNITGRFDFTLQQISTPAIARSAEDVPELAYNWPVSQLGLALQPTKIPGLILTIDHIERPTPN